jgi:hypothetical protein
MPDRRDDPLDELRDRVRAAQAAAERLAGEAAGAGRAAGEGRPPPAGWATPGAGDAPGEDLQALAALLGTLREIVPAELRAQLEEVIRQVLLLVRAVIDWWLERIDGERGAEPDVEDIPIT